MKKIISILWFIVLSWFTVAAQDTLTLMEAIGIGLENNYSIRLQQNQQEIAGNNNTIGNAGMLPSLQLEVTPNLTVSTSNSQYINNTEKNVSNAQNTSFAAGLKLSWTLFDGLEMFAAKNTFDILEQMGETGARLVLENTVSSIILTFYGIIQQKKLIQVQADAAGLSLERKKLAAAKIKIGAGSGMMLLQSTV
ncbi:MAG: TolC family protein, partial [Bacteroidetes bacterium]|nr:TolC family protein [Bacteroidota bacterium]